MENNLWKARLSQFVGTPVYMAQDKLSMMLSYLKADIDLNSFASAFNIVPSALAIGGGQQTTTFLKNNGAAFIEVRGPIFAKEDPWDARYGWASYERIAREFSEAEASPDVSKIVFLIASPGGIATGMIDTMDFIKAKKTKPVVAFVDEYALSGAYAIASTADEIITTRSGMVGSIGAVITHVDVTEMDKMDGVSYQYFHFGAKKVDGSPHIPLSESASNEYQARVDALGGEFANAVAKNIGVSLESIKATEAGVFMGEEAVKKGLATKVMTAFDFYNSFTLADGKDQKQTKSMKKGVKHMDITLEDLKKENPEIVKALASEASAPLLAQIDKMKADQSYLVEMVGALDGENSSLKASNTETSTRILALEKSDSIRRENEIRSSADAIFNTKLEASGIREELFPKVKKQITYTSYVKDGAFDAKAFSDAVDEEIKDWVGADGQVKTIIGYGTSRIDAAVQNAQKDDEMADSLFAFVK